jgi:hypothetical protein
MYVCIVYVDTYMPVIDRDHDHDRDRDRDSDRDACIHVACVRLAQGAWLLRRHAMCRHA